MSDLRDTLIEVADASWMPRGAYWREVVGGLLDLWLPLVEQAISQARQEGREERGSDFEDRVNAGLRRMEARGFVI